MKFNTKAWIVITVGGAIVAKDPLFKSKLSAVRNSSYFRAVGSSISRVGVFPRGFEMQPMKISKHRIKEEPLRMISFLSSSGPY